MSIRYTTLPNGLRIVTDNAPGIESLALGFWVGVGTRHELAQENGIAHMLEHMMFKGTATRSAKDLSDLIEDAGGYFNAYTAREVTAYYIRILKDHLDLSLNVLADMLQNSIFPEDEIEKERTVILQEIKMYEDSPDDMVFQNALEAAFPEQAVGSSGLGTPEIVSKISVPDLKTYIGKHYAAERIVISCAGDIDHDQFVALVEKYFLSFPAQSLNGNNPGYVAANYNPRHALVEKETEQAHIIIGFKGASKRSADYPTQRILSNILGGGTSSRLYHEIREKHGLVYTIQTFQDSYSDAGLFGVYAGTGPEELKKLIPLTIEQINSMADGVSEQEINRAKSQISSNVRMAREKMMTRADQQGRYMLTHGTTFDTQSYIEKINRVTEQDIIDYAKKLFTSPLMVSAYGPIGANVDPTEIEENIRKKYNNLG
ncbi:MAG TPA: pitrilysin family protein [Alphaproteobacteria bacterium]|nr:insulinase family protein [Alphaproteobacteria bacterium]HOO50194.1 pitrilysin family protein [Alphaproteobacteria bacterium]